MQIHPSTWQERPSRIVRRAAYIGASGKPSCACVWVRHASGRPQPACGMALLRSTQTSLCPVCPVCVFAGASTVSPRQLRTLGCRRRVSAPQRGKRGERADGTHSTSLSPLSLSPPRLHSPQNELSTPGACGCGGGPWGPPSRQPRQGGRAGILAQPPLRPWRRATGSRVARHCRQERPRPLREAFPSALASPG